MGESVEGFGDRVELFDETTAARRVLPSDAIPPGPAAITGTTQPRFDSPRRVRTGWRLRCVALAQGTSLSPGLLLAA
jgi:hypothetical protein